MKKRLIHLLTGCALLVSAAVNGQIINGTFDINNPGSTTCNSVYGWQTSNDIQWENQWNTSGDTWWADLTGCGWGNGHYMEQTVATVPGTTYVLWFDLGCWNGQCYTDAGADLYIDGGYISRFAHTDFSGSPLAWETFHYCFVATGNTTTVRFVGHGEGTSLTQPWANPIDNFVGVIGLDNVHLDAFQGSGGIIYTTNCVPAILSHNLSGGTAYWYFNGNPISTSQFWVATQPGTYTLVYVTDCGVIEDFITLIDCKDHCPWKQDFTIQNVKGDHPETYCMGEPVVFNGFATGGIPLQYSWDFGDGTSAPYSNGGAITHVYTHPGVYNVCMTVKEKPGETKPSDCDKTPLTICKTVVVVDCGDTGTGTWPNDPGGDKTLAMQLPYPGLNVFPNPANDQVSVTGLMEEKAETLLSLYNISGALVYQQIVEAGKIEARLSLKGLDAGVYLLKITGTQYSSEVKLVKN